VAGVLEKYRYSKEIETNLAAALGAVMRGMVVGNRSLLLNEKSITIVHVPGGREEVRDDYVHITDLNQARAEVRDQVIRTLKFSTADREVLGELAASFVDANLYHDPEITRERREKAGDQVLPMSEKVARGTVLVPRGERVDQAALEVLEAIRKASANRFGLLEWLGLLAMVAMIVFFLFRYATYHQRAFKRIRRLHALMVLVLIAVLLLSRGMMWVFRHVVDALPQPFNHVEDYVFLIPVSAGAILITLLANGRIAMVYSTFAAILFGAMLEWNFFYGMWALLVQFAAVYAITTYRDRAALLRAGLIIGMFGAGASLALQTIEGTPAEASRLAFGAGLAFIGGAVGAGLLVSFTLPLLEGAFNVLTEIRLLELSNLDNPLLSQLAVKAPGSYNHSLVVGSLAEDGAKAIGANSLFCRVAAFYHDIGKMVKPDYYVENQRGENPHEKLTPSMSALIIASHVKDGIRMAREAGLPEQIVDIIPQHHGTRLMTYFYEKARTASENSQATIKKEDYRYPGPKPQTREAAIFMLADAAEAAARTVDEPTQNRLREMIRKVTNAIMLDRQLDECDLTFADLERIQSAFLRMLVSIYHHRVEYPGFEFGSGEIGPQEPES
jgi:putative nucleotidyltransferase with HDIG domain